MFGPKCLKTVEQYAIVTFHVLHFWECWVTLHFAKWEVTVFEMRFQSCFWNLLMFLINLNLFLHIIHTFSSWFRFKIGFFKMLITWRNRSNSIWTYKPYTEAVVVRSLLIPWSEKLKLRTCHFHENQLIELLSLAWRLRRGRVASLTRSKDIFELVGLISVRIFLWLVDCLVELITPSFSH